MHINEVRPHPYRIHKNHSKWLKDLNIRHDTIKLPKDKDRQNIIGHKLHQYFLWSVFQDNRNKSKNKWDLIKFLSFCTAKEIINNKKRQPMAWEQTVATNATDKWLILKICKHLIQLCVVLLLSHFSHAQLFATLWTAARQPPSSMGFSWQVYWRKLPCPPPGDLPSLETQPASPASLALQADSLLLSHWGRPTEQKNQTTQSKKLAEDLNRYASKEEIQMTNRHMKRCSILLIIREMQMKTTMR